MNILPDGSAFFVAEIDSAAPNGDPVKWNPFNKVVQDHRDGTIHQPETDQERARRGLPPFDPVFANTEAMETPVW